MAKTLELGQTETWRDFYERIKISDSKRMIQDHVGTVGGSVPAHHLSINPLKNSEGLCLT